MTPSKEEFQAWRADPTTRWVMAAMASFAGKQRDEWMARTFDAGGHPDVALLVELRTRADAYRAISDSTFEDWMNTHGEVADPQ